MEAPIETEFKVWITNGENYGQITVTMAKGRYPTQTDVDKALRQAQDALDEGDFDDWKLCESPREFMEGLVLKEYGQRMAVAAAGEWEPPYSSRGSTSAA